MGAEPAGQNIIYEENPNMLRGQEKGEMREMLELVCVS
jgi:hypothetical protein